MYVLHENITQGSATGEIVRHSEGYLKSLPSSWVLPSASSVMWYFMEAAELDLTSNFDSAQF